jgi:uncharacterized Zn finger protein
MQDIRPRAQAVMAAETAAARLVDVSDAVRQARAQSVRVDGLVVTDEAVHAAVRSSDGSTVYRVRVRHTPHQGWRCSCPDAGQRGTIVGPCKHAVAVARAAVQATRAEMATVAAVLVSAP